MKINVKTGNILEEQTELAVIGFFEGEELCDPLSKVGTLLENNCEFTGKFKQTMLLHNLEDVVPKRVLLLGLGKPEKINLEKIRELSAKTASQTENIGVKCFKTVIYGSGKIDIKDTLLSRAIVEGTILGLYKFDKYKTESKKDKCISELTILISDDANYTEILDNVNIGKILAEATNTTKDFANESPNIATPYWMAQKAKKLATTYNLDIQILDKNELEKLNMGGILAVGQGSVNEPQLIILEHNKDRKDLDTIVLIGKTITFDSGGISLKPWSGMDQMKFDKSGGCAVLGIMKAVSQLDIPLRIVGILPATENLPSGTAYRPGDILNMASGKTVEVLSTDAEGRLTLADALDYASKTFNPKLMIDIATLTGACSVALGEYASGMMGNNKEMMKLLEEASDISGDRVWELPLWEEYYELNKGVYADIQNTGGRTAGAITAGAFLGEFVDKVPWIHLDIAGTAWATSKRSYYQKGSTGQGVRLLTQFLMEEYK